MGVSRAGRAVPTAATLRRMYHDEHLSQRQIARRVGYSQVTVGRWLRRHGIAASIARDPTRRFWARVDKTATCWLFRTGRKRYPTIWYADRLQDTHRVSWQMHYGAIPAGQYVLHRCDTPRCVRPDHLFLGTARDNAADMIRKGRAHWQRAIHPTAGGSRDLTAGLERAA